MSTLLFSVIIVAYKNSKIVVDCLGSIEKFNDIGPFLEVIVVDNTPNGLVASLLEPLFPNVVFLKNKYNGFGLANNIGAKTAKGKFLLFLNPDTLIIEPVFRFAVDKFHSDARLGLFGVKLLDQSLKRNMSFYFIDWPGFLGSQIIKLCNFLNIYIDGLMYVSGANIFIRRDIFLKCGMFDENIFMYYEEPDLSKRVKSLGFKTAFYRSKKIVHLEGKCTNDSEFALRQRLKSLKYYCKKYDLDFIFNLRKEIAYVSFKKLCYGLFDSTKTSEMERHISIMQDVLSGGKL